MFFRDGQLEDDDFFDPASRRQLGSLVSMLDGTNLHSFLRKVSQNDDGDEEGAADAPAAEKGDNGLDYSEKDPGAEYFSTISEAMDDDSDEEVEKGKDSLLMPPPPPTNTNSTSSAAPATSEERVGGPAELPTKTKKEEPPSITRKIQKH